MSSGQNISSLISSIYRSRVTLLKQLNFQGYNTSEYDGFSINEVNSMFQNKQLDMLLEKIEEDSDLDIKTKIYVRFFVGKLFRPANIQELIDDLFNMEETLNKHDTLLIITSDDLNDTAKDFVKHIWEQDKIFIIIQNIKRLQYNVLEHTLVPLHQIIDTKEILEVKSKYNITSNSLFPEISRFDPVAICIGMKPGNICKILRPSKTAITAPYYRFCVNN